MARSDFRALAISAAALAAAIASPGVAAAQESDGATASGLDEIVVTARKREENLQDTPISIAAFSGDALETRQVTNVAEIGRFTPNMTFEPAAQNAGASFAVTTSIRGIGQTDFALTIDPGVGIYVDGVYVSRSVGALLDTADVASLQVLRGPQGTLFGKNTIGGAVVLTSKLPVDEFEGSLELTTGRYDRFDARGMVNVPLGEGAALRANLSYQSRDGYVRRLSDGGVMGNKDSLSARVQALVEPSDALRIVLSADYTRAHELGIPVVALDTNDATPELFSFFYNKVLNGATCGFPGTPTPDLPACFTNQWVTGTKNTTWASDPNYSNLDLWGVSATVDLDVGFANFKSISAYRDLDSSFGLDGDGTPILIANTSNEYSQWQFSQEFQLGGKAAEGKLDWVVGLYYLKEKGLDRNFLLFPVANFLSGGSIDNDSYAAFAQATYAITDRVNLTLGGRYTYEKKRFLPDQRITDDFTGGSLLALSQLFIPDPALNPDGDRILPPVERTATARKFTPAVTLDYKFSPEVLGYLSYSQGFKSGGFTQRVFPPLSEVPAFAPEFVDSYEAGLKTELLDRRLRLNLAAFWSDYRDLQILVQNGVAPTVRNAGDARIKGFEAEVQAELASWAQFNGGVGYTDARYRSLSPLAVGVTLDSQLPNAPKWTATAGLSLEVLETSAGTLSLRGDWSYKGAAYKEAANTPVVLQKAFHLVNLSATFAAPDRNWSLSAGVTNLTNRSYLLSANNQLGAAGSAAGTFSRPREWFLRAKYSF